MARRDKMVARFQQLVSEKGEAAVLYYTCYGRLTMGRGAFSGAKVFIGLAVFACAVYSYSPSIGLFNCERGIHMLKKVAAVLFMVVLVFSVSAPGFAQGAAKEDRVEGRIVRSSEDKSTLTVGMEKLGERTVHYDASPKWTSKYHGEKKVNTIDASQVKDGDYVICLGSYDDKKEFHATMISKRLSHSPE